MFNFRKKLTRLTRIERVLHTHHRGIFKRVDENRELLACNRSSPPG